MAEASRGAEAAPSPDMRAVSRPGTRDADMTVETTVGGGVEAAAGGGGVSAGASVMLEAALERIVGRSIRGGPPVVFRFVRAPGLITEPALASSGETTGERLKVAVSSVACTPAGASVATGGKGSSLISSTCTGPVAVFVARSLKNARTPSERPIRMTAAIHAGFRGGF